MQCYPDDAELRWRSLPELPVGEIEHVRVFVASDTICEVLLRVADQEVLLVAGELDEHFDGRLIFRYLDESVLVFTDPDAASKIPWWAGNREGVTLYAESSSEQRP